MFSPAVGKTSQLSALSLMRTQDGLSIKQGQHLEKNTGADIFWGESCWLERGQCFISPLSLQIVSIQNS